MHWFIAWHGRRLKQSIVVALAFALSCACFPSLARAPLPPMHPAHGVLGVGDAQLTPEFWLARLRSPDRVLLTPLQIAAKNTHVAALEDALHDLAALPATLPRSQITSWLQNYDAVLKRPLFDESGKPVPPTVIQTLREAIAGDRIAEQVPVRFGLVVQRAALRSVPSNMRVFSRQGETDIDRFQESAEFPGTPVVIVHASRDGQWLFVVSPRYAAWMEKRFVAEGPKQTVLAYVDKKPYRIATGAEIHTVYTREEPRVSELQLDMGTRVALSDAAPDHAIHGQHPYASWILELPVRNTDGSVAFIPALLPKSADSSGNYLPMTEANIIAQAFKFLGERYGWGHSYNGRDCSGFVSEVYRSMGVLLPRNTGDQATSPGLQPLQFSEADGSAKREAAIASLQVGDLIYIPGHVMMMIGRIDGAPYVIHDTSGGSMRGSDGQLRSLHLNGVVVTPLAPLMFDQQHRYIDRINSIVRMRQAPP